MDRSPTYFGTSATSSIPRPASSNSKNKLRKNTATGSTGKTSSAMKLDKCVLDDFKTVGSLNNLFPNMIGGTSNLDSNATPFGVIRNYIEQINSESKTTKVLSNSASNNKYISTSGNFVTGKQKRRSSKKLFYVPEMKTNQRKGNSKVHLVQEKENVPNDLIIGPLNETIDEDNSSREFNEIEASCRSPTKLRNENNVSQSLNDEFKDLMQKQREETNKKMQKILDEHDQAVTDLFNKTVSKGNLLKSVKMAKNPVNLLTHTLKSNAAKSIADTPSTKKNMAKANQLYNRINNNGLDSPMANKSALSTPTTGKPLKKALSIKVQKQCLALME